jgi:hypothetical protein
MRRLSPIEMMINAACGHVPAAAPRRDLVTMRVGPFPPQVVPFGAKGASTHIEREGLRATHRGGVLSRPTKPMVRLQALHRGRSSVPRRSHPKPSCPIDTSSKHALRKSRLGRRATKVEQQLISSREPHRL